MFALPGDFVQMETFCMGSHYFGPIISVNIPAFSDASVVGEPLDSNDVMGGDRCMITGLQAPATRIKRVGNWMVLNEFEIEGDRWR